MTCNVRVIDARMKANELAINAGNIFHIDNVESEMMH